MLFLVSVISLNAGPVTLQSLDVFWVNDQNYSLVGDYLNGSYIREPYRDSYPFDLSVAPAVSFQLSYFNPCSPCDRRFMPVAMHEGSMMTTSVETMGGGVIAALDANKVDGF